YALRGLGLLQRKFKVVAVALALEFLQVVVVASNQSAHHPHVAGGAIELGFGCLQVGLGGFDIFFRAGYVGGDRADLGLALFLRFRNRRRQFLVRSSLLFADGFRTAASFGQFGL